jgi:hypothetical protein
MEDPEELQGDSPNPDEGQQPNVRSLIRPHSAKGKKPPSRGSPSSSPDPPMGRIRRPWSAHPKTRADVSKKKLVRENLKKSHMRPPNRRQVSKTERAVAEDNVVDESQVLGLECPGLDYTPQRYRVRDDLQDSEGRSDDVLDHGVTTLVSGKRNGDQNQAKLSKSGGRGVIKLFEFAFHFKTQTFSLNS